jgi:hypothetical protein
MSDYGKRIYDLRAALKRIAQGPHNPRDGKCPAECPACIAAYAREAEFVIHDIEQIAYDAVYSECPLETMRKQVTMDLQRAYERGRRNGSKNTGQT